MSRILQDIRFALRQLRTAPGFTVTAILTLALGIGANAAIFTLIHALLLTKLPVPHPEQLVRLGGDHLDCCVWGGRGYHGEFSIFSTELYDAIRKNTPEFQELAAAQAGMASFAVRRPGSADAALADTGHFVSGNYFQMLQVTPAAGRLLQPSDDVENAAPVAVISYAAWERDFAKDPSIIGSSLIINTHPITIIGVTPKEFFGDKVDSFTPDFYSPLWTEPLLGTGNYMHHPENRWLHSFGRIKPGVELGPLQAKISATIVPVLAKMPYYSDTDGRQELKKVHVPLSQHSSGLTDTDENTYTGLKLLMGVAGVVLLIACANLANLVLARGMARRSEISVRTALGASRSRIIRQMLTESLLLSCMGGIVGLAVAYLGASLLLKIAIPHTHSSALAVTPSPQILLFALGISALTGLLFGVVPAFVTSNANPADALRGANRTTGGKASLLQRGLVVFQSALSLVLLVAAGLLTKSLINLQHQNFGMQVEHRVVGNIGLNKTLYTPDQLPVLYQRLHDKMMQIPGVEKAELTMYTPLSGDSWSDGVWIQGRQKPGLNDDVGATWDRMTPGFLDAIGEPVLRGRGLLPTDTATSPGVAVVNQAFVKKFFPHGEEPIGQHFGTNDVKSVADREIVGVVADTKYQDVSTQQRPMFFLPPAQLARSNDAKEKEGEERSLYLEQVLLVTKGPMPNLELQMRKVLASINPDLNLQQFETMEGQISDQMVNSRLTARLTMMFALLALILASVGLYGVTAYSVTRRTSEIGVRMALGAARSSVVAMVMRESMLQTGIGLALGIPAVVLVAHYMTSLQAELYNMAAIDWTVIAGAAFALAFASSIAGLIPAQRAASLDPAQTLRTE